LSFSELSNKWTMSYRFSSFPSCVHHSCLLDCGFHT
jgi:hypothetical protein